MLDGQNLMLVLSQPPSPRQRCTWLTQDTQIATEAIASHLRTRGIEKSHSRIVGDMLVEAMSQLAMSWNAADSEVAQRVAEESSRVLAAVDDTSRVTKVKMKYPLSESWMECVDSICDKLNELHGKKPSRSAVTRALAHMAAREVRNVIHALH
jgi:hypothetical protein